MTHHPTANLPRFDLPEPADLPIQAALPDPLRTLAGERVSTAAVWREQRRAELLALFSHYVYGPMPPAPPQPPRVRELLRDATFLDGRAELREIELRFEEPVTFTMHLLLVLPREHAEPVPTLLGFNRWGNHTVVSHPRVTLPTCWVSPVNDQGEHRASESQRGCRAHIWPVEKIIARGYGLASWFHNELAPDSADFPFSFRNEHGEQVETGTLAAWAWGASRALDALSEIPEIDAARVGVLGHSRRGKASLLAAAFDERFALAFPHQAGCGGTAPSRTENPKAETVERITRTFPHWFCDRFAQFGDTPQRLPIDQHELVALMAPRPVLLSAAEGDQWANPPGQFHMLQAAEPVYHLCGATGLGGATQPRMQTLMGHELGYFLRPGEHATTVEDWETFLNFADRHLSRNE